jgi:membrane-bound lytic murein transglycosylase MltF
MLERRRIRVLAPYSRSLFFHDKGHERGLSAELVRDFERYLNKKYKKELRNRPLTVLLIPRTRDRLIEDVAKGLGDIAVGNLTETPARLAVVDFVAPRDRKPVREVVLTVGDSLKVLRVDDLAGRTVHVRASSSYHEHLIALNERFKTSGKPPIDIRLVSDALEDEDLMEMLNAGLFQILIVDDWKAGLWSKVLPNIRVTDVAIAEGGYTGWAIRKGSPELAAVIADFYATQVKAQSLIETRLAQYHKRIRQISNNTESASWKRFEQILALFRKYGEKYGFDPLMLAAQGYQESKLRQDARSHVGAIGVMQIMPATGAELGVGDIGDLEPNIHGGAKYMDQLMTRYFKDADFSGDNRTLFAFASYNAGPGNISRMMKIAEKEGLDPLQWFNNVELVVAKKIGIETTTYVRNIYKYYVAYKLTLEARETQREARKKISKGKG